MRSKSEVGQPKTEFLSGFRIGGRLEGVLEFLHGQSSIAYEATESAPLQRIVQGNTYRGAARTTHEDMRALLPCLLIAEPLEGPYCLLAGDNRQLGY